MKILALDTSNVALSVAVLEDSKLLAMQTTNIKKNHSQQLMPIIQQTLKAAMIPVSEIDRIVVAKGPGSYTGLRIAVTTAKTLALSINAELVGVSSLEALVLNAPSNGLVVPYFSARNGNVFAGIYRKKGMKYQVLMPDSHLRFENLLDEISSYQESVYFVGTDFDEFKELAENELKVTFGYANEINALPSAHVLGLIGYRSNNLEDKYSFTPSYLRQTEAERNWKESHPNDENEAYVRKIY